MSTNPFELRLQENLWPQAFRHVRTSPGGCLPTALSLGGENQTPSAVVVSAAEKGEALTTEASHKRCRRFHLGPRTAELEG